MIHERHLIVYDWRPLLPHEEFRYDYFSDYEKGEEPEVSLGYLVDFADGGIPKIFMRHQDSEHGKYPIQHHYHKDMLKALREQMDVSSDFVFPCDYVSYGYIESCKRQKLVGG